MKKGQNLVEYLLIAMIVAVAGYAFASKMDLNAIKNYVFMRPVEKGSSQIKIEAMTK